MDGSNWFVKQNFSYLDHHLGLLVPRSSSYRTNLSMGFLTRWICECTVLLFMLYEQKGMSNSSSIFDFPRLCGLINSSSFHEAFLRSAWHNIIPVRTLWTAILDPALSQFLLFSPPCSPLRGCFGVDWDLHQSWSPTESPGKTAMP